MIKCAYWNCNNLFTPRNSIHKCCSKKCSQIVAVSRRRKELKLKAISYKGGRCTRCGYDKYEGALEFHHLDPSEKDFSISRNGTTKSWERVKEELDKCILVCANCHRELHAGLVHDLIPVVSDKLIVVPRSQIECETCGELTTNNKYCSVICSSKARSKAIVTKKIVIFLIILVMLIFTPYIVGSIALGPKYPVISPVIDVIVTWLIGVLLTCAGLAVILVALLISGILKM